MDRLNFFHEAINKSCVGLEIGPLHSPICPKRNGWHTLTLDICDSDWLKEKYKNDPGVDCSKIEEVDVISKESLFTSVQKYTERDIALISNPNGSLQYIISSHNFEHQPNPLGFLRDSEALLQEGGYLTMAIPVASRCFDCFLPLTTSGQAIDSFLRGCNKPSPGAIFDQRAYHATMGTGESINDLNYNINDVVFPRQPGINFLNQLNAQDGVYIDAHVSRFNHFSFELLIRDAMAIGILESLIIEEKHLHGSEFLVRLKKDSARSNSSKAYSRHERLWTAQRSIKFHIQDLAKRN